MKSLFRLRADLRCHMANGTKVVMSNCDFEIMAESEDDAKKRLNRIATRAFNDSMEAGGQVEFVEQLVVLRRAMA